MTMPSTWRGREFRLDIKNGKLSNSWSCTTAAVSAVHETQAGTPQVLLMSCCLNNGAHTNDITFVHSVGDYKKRAEFDAFHGSLVDDGKRNSCVLTRSSANKTRECQEEGGGG